MSENPKRSAPSEQPAGDREVDPSENPGPRENPEPDPEKIEKVKEEMDRISGN